MATLIVKADITSVFVQFTQNIEDRIINPHINDAQRFDFEPIVPAAFYTAITGTPGTELASFLTNFVKPFLIMATMPRFLLWQGANISQYGVRTMIENTSQQVSDKWRAELIKDTENKRNIYHTKMFNELKDKAYTFDGVVYNFSTCSEVKGKGFGIRSVSTSFDNFTNQKQY